MVVATRAAETGGRVGAEGHIGAPPKGRSAHSAAQGTNPTSAPPSRPEGQLEEIRALHEEGAKQRDAPGGAEVSLKLPPTHLLFRRYCVVERPRCCGGRKTSVHTADEGHHTQVAKSPPFLSKFTNF